MSNPPHSSWPDRVKWAEEQGLKNLEQRFVAADTINAEAQTTLTYALAGMGTTFAYSLGIFEKPATLPLFVSVLLCGYFALIGGYLVVRTRMLGVYPSTFQEPQHLIKDPHEPLERVRKGAVNGMEERISAAINWSTGKANAVNLARIALVLSPVVAVLAVLAYRFFGAQAIQGFFNFLVSG